MKKLKDILYKVAVEAVYGSTDVSVNILVFDSRKVTKNDVFIALKGTVVDAHQYIPSVIESGASVIICEDLPENTLENIVYVLVKDSKEALAIMADNFYENPSQKLKLIGITGTNGKTTIATLLYNLFKVSTGDLLRNEIKNKTEIGNTNTSTNFF